MCFGILGRTPGLEEGASNPATSKWGRAMFVGVQGGDRAKERG